MTSRPEGDLAVLPQSAVFAGRASNIYQKCFSSLGCPELSLEQLADLAGEFEIPCLELRFLKNRSDLPTLLADFPGGWKGVADYLRERGLRSQVLGTSFKLVGHTPALWSELMDFAALAEALKAPYVRAFGGGTWGYPLTPDDYQAAAEALDFWETERRARGWNVRLLIETHDAFSASAPCLQLMEVVGHPLDFIWDSHHTWRLGGESPSESWAVLAPFVRHVHLKDSIGRPSARHPFTYVLPGSGEMPGREVLDLLKRDGFTGAVSLEWEKMWHPYLGSLGDAFLASRENQWG
ncbi:TIM barrel protein [soil metagenome]